ncbi:glutamic-type intramembrane protease PrsW [Metabacillus arenae]|uniref:Protease PrsW n=1 Tax=Metabacillus arenae TaxID=2771434 RepID=A0A926NIU1_9BACI|nr:glutamic-type intramembrane protease PrsW [Metabacillus arenae]MBD1378636.1 intramembrane metalloprotease PrsW [Metabacillus arenae]
MFAIISAGIAPGIAILIYFYLKDQYDSEPFHMVFRSFIFGALLVFPLMFVQYVIKAENIFPSIFSHAFVTSGLLEEFFKWFILMVTIYQHVHFDEHYDGIVYGASVSLGFATLENILFLVGNGVEHAIGRAILPVSSHALFGVIMGYYIGKGKFSTYSSKYKWLTYSLLIPIFLHGFYDYIIMAYEHWGYYMMPFMLFLWWFGLHKAKKARLIKKHA